MKSFDEKRTGTGTKEWAEVTENITRGCSNDCRYCYAATNANRFNLRSRKDWQVEEMTKQAYMKSYPARDGVIMFPSAHDITRYNLFAYIRIAALILSKGNRLLIVTKPRIDCVREIVEQLKFYSGQILFRFTITSLNPVLSKFWEPGAPQPSERLEALKHAWQQGFPTSVSVEPMIDGVDKTESMVAGIQHLVTDTIWIGKLNKANIRCDKSIPGMVDALRVISEQQSDSEIMRLVANLKNEPKVRWKDSINEVIARNTK